jgi:hypothetical protein
MIHNHIPIAMITKSTQRIKKINKKKVNGQEYILKTDINIPKPKL